ncbi:hypothetical protein LCGC14_0657160 [marine sediment metagenome]|uniref:tRNA/rRNA methyltransferase SpoU type domain-containing protein n=1 Tax=marine sediment metagenome TaxID=412755 RepID=A0A0F9TG97_9ZZZZ
MKIIFFIKSETVDISNYTIKNIPGSSGRLDVISRCILAALLAKDGFEKKIQIWVFLDKYGTFIFNSEKLSYEIFPKNEIYLTDCFVDFLCNNSSNGEIKTNPLNTIEKSNLNIIKAIKQFIKANYKVFVLKEDGSDFLKLRKKFKDRDNIVFIIGSQEDKFLNSKELSTLKLPSLSIGKQSYLASSVIRLLKLHLLLLP